MTRTSLAIVSIVGLMLLGVLAGIAKRSQTRSLIGEDTPMLKISSPAFAQGKNIPQKYSCDGENINPTLQIEGVPTKTQSLALIMDDPDAPGGNWNHWLLWNIDPQIREIGEGSSPEGAVAGINSSGKDHYVGPCPPGGTHRYFFRLYALDAKIDLPVGSSRARLLEVIKDHIIGESELMGTYFRRTLGS